MIYCLSIFIYLFIFLFGSSCCPQMASLYLIMAACMAALGGVLFGYDIGEL